MAIARKVWDLIPFVLPIDSAVRSADAWRAYAQSGFDLAKLEQVEGEKPTIFWLRQLKHGQHVHAASLAQASGYESGTLPPEASVFVARCALARVENLEHEKGGVTVEAPRVEHESTTFGELVKPEWFERAQLGVAAIQMIATAAYQASEVSVPLGKR